MMTIFKSSIYSILKNSFHYFGQDQASVSFSQKIRAALGMFCGLLCTVYLSKILGGMVDVDEWFMASLGASSLLVFALPSSPMAQPWAVITGNVISALVGIFCSRIIGDPLIAIPMAGSTAILGMFLLRCLHPPAAAVALIAVMGHVVSFRYALFPVFIDSVILCLVASLFNSLTGKPYPTRPQYDAIGDDAKKLVEANAKLNALLDEYQEVINVDRAELIKLMRDGFDSKKT